MAGKRPDSQSSSLSAAMSVRGFLAKLTVPASAITLDS